MVQLQFSEYKQKLKKKKKKGSHYIIYENCLTVFCCCCFVGSFVKYSFSVLSAPSPGLSAVVDPRKRDRKKNRKKESKQADFGLEKVYHLVKNPHCKHIKQLEKNLLTDSDFFF